MLQSVRVKYIFIYFTRTRLGHLLVYFATGWMLTFLSFAVNLPQIQEDSKEDNRSEILGEVNCDPKFGDYP